MLDQQNQINQNYSTAQHWDAGEASANRAGGNGFCSYGDAAINGAQRHANV